MKVVPSDNHVITPAALRKLLEALPAKLIVPVVLKAFCGLRTEENHPLRWEYLRLESKAIVIRAELAKLSQRRAPPILPNLAKWQAPFQGLTGPINPDYRTPHTPASGHPAAAHQGRLRTTNALERVNMELKRRTRVAGLFPNELSLLRLVSALLAEFSDEWETGKVSLNMECQTQPSV